MARLYRVTHPRSRGSLVMKVPKLGPGSPLSATAAFENERQILRACTGRMSRGSWPWAIRGGGRIWSWNTSTATRCARASARRCPWSRCRSGRAVAARCTTSTRQNVIHLDLCPATQRPREQANVLVGFRRGAPRGVAGYLRQPSARKKGRHPYTGRNRCGMWHRAAFRTCTPSARFFITSPPASDPLAAQSVVTQEAPVRTRAAAAPAQPRDPAGLRRLISCGVRDPPERRYPTARQASICWRTRRRYLTERALAPVAAGGVDAHALVASNT